MIARFLFLAGRAASVGVFAMTVSGAAFARSGDDPLPAKGLPIRLPAEGASDGAGSDAARYGDGFRLETADGRFLMRVGGRLQARATYEHVRDEEDTSSFRVRRARMLFRGHAFDPSIEYKLQISFTDDSDDGRTILQDAWMEWRPHESLGLRAGQFKAPFGRQQLTKSLFLQFQERSRATRFFSLGREIGVMGSWAGFDGGLDVRAGIFNGEGPDRAGFVNDNNEMLAVGRVQLNPWGGWKNREGDRPRTARPRASFGASAYYDPMGRREMAGVRSEFDAFGFGLDGALRYAGLFATGELFRRSIDEAGSADFEVIDEDGFFVQAGAMLGRDFEIAARYSAIGVEDIVDEDTRELGLSLTYLIQGDRHKLQVEWGRLEVDPEGGAEHEEDFVRLQWTLEF